MTDEDEGASVRAAHQLTPYLLTSPIVLVIKRKQGGLVVSGVLSATHDSYHADTETTDKPCASYVWFTGSRDPVFIDWEQEGTEVRAWMVDRSREFDFPGLT